MRMPTVIRGLLLVESLVLVLYLLILLLLLIDLRLAGLPRRRRLLLWGCRWGRALRRGARWRALLRGVGSYWLPCGGLYRLGRALDVSAIRTGTNATYDGADYDGNDDYDDQGSDDDPLPGVPGAGLGLDEGARPLVYVALGSVDLG